MKRKAHSNSEWLTSLKDYEDIVNRELDNELLAKARKFNMTSRHVKDIIYRVCSNKDLLDFARRIAGNDRKSKTDRLTRTKLRKTGFPPNNDFNPQNSGNDQIPTEVDIDGYYGEADSDSISENSDNTDSETKPENEGNERDERDDHSVWLKWLAEMRQPDIPIREEIEENDEDYYCHLDDLEEDEEEFRDDKAVVISNREIKLLLDELDREEVDFCVTKSRIDLENNPEEFPVISAEDKENITAQLQQHVIILVQMYIISTSYKLKEPASRQAMYFLNEIFQFTPSEGKDYTKTISLFAKSNIFQAMETISRWDRILYERHIPLIFGSSPENGWRVNYNINLASNLEVTCWTSFRFPPLSNRIMAFFITQPLFALYPSLLPACGIHIFSQNQINISDLDMGLTSSMNYDFNNFKIKFSPAENYLLLMGYLQFGDNFELIEKNMLPSRMWQRIKFRFRFLLQNPQKMDIDLRMMLMRGHVDINTMNCPLVKDSAVISRSLTLLSTADLPDFTPPWVNLLKDRKHWNSISVNYDYLENQTVKIQYQNEALSALNIGNSILIPENIVFKNNTQLEPPQYEDCKIPAKNSVMTDPNLRTCSLYDLKNDRYNLEQAYCKMAYLRAKEVKTDINSISENFSKVLLDILKDFHPDGDSFNHFLENIKDIDCTNHSEVLNKLITLSKQHKSFLMYISYIFGLRENSSAYRFWFEFIQLCKNLQEIQEALELNSYHHRKFLIFLSQLSSLNLPTMNIKEIQSLLPIPLQSFKKICLTDQMSVPSFFRILQTYGSETPVKLIYEQLEDRPHSADTDLKKPAEIIFDITSNRIKPKDKKT